MHGSRQVALALTGLFVLAGCGPATADRPHGVGPAHRADRDATLRYTMGTDAGGVYDPHTSSNPFVDNFLYPVYDGLTRVGPDGTVQPMLATGWRFTDDGRALVLTLRQNVRFQDGTPFDAAAVKANLERARTNPRSTVTANLATVSGIDVVDPHTVRLNLSAPTASLPGLLADRAGMMISPRALGNRDLDLKPVGAGPYRVDTDEPGVRVTYSRFDGYWNPSAQRVKRIEISVEPDPDARVRAVRSGQTDVTIISPDRLDAARRAGHTQVFSSPTIGMFLLYLNKSRPELADARVRRALSLAIDRNAINRALQYGQCAPSSQPFPAGYWAGAPDVAAVPYDPTAARKLLAEAGLPDGFSMSAVVVDIPFFAAQLEAIQAQWAQIGVKLTVTPLDPTQLLSRFTEQKSADAYFSIWPGATDPATTVAALYLPDSFLNPGGYGDSELTSLAAQGVAALDQRDRAQVYRRLSKVAAQTDFHLVVCRPTNAIVASNRISGIQTTLASVIDVDTVAVSR